MKTQDKTYIVTGAGGGIGSAIASGILARGGRVAAVDLRDDSLQALRISCGDAAERLSLHPLDITDRQAVAMLPQAVISAHGQVDGLINCAGIVQPFVKINDLDYETIERVMNVNFYGTLNLTKALLPHLLKRNEAHIANVSSMGGFLPVPGQSVYGASKAAVKLFTEGLYAELLDTAVRVSIIFPGATKTDITKNSNVTAPNMPQDATASSVPMLTAEQAATIILNGIEANKPHIYTGSDSKFMNKLYRLRPVFATKFITLSLIHI